MYPDRGGLTEVVDCHAAFGLQQIFKLPYNYASTTLLDPAATAVSGNSKFIKGNIVKFLVIAFSAILLSACAAKTLNPGAERVLLSNSPPSDSCIFLGEVHGGQGNWWTDDITSTRSLVEGSRNDLRNQAHAIGANYIHIQQTAQDTSYIGGGKIGMAGHAFDCPNQ